MTKLIPAEHGVVMHNEDSLFHYFGWPSVAKLPDGRLAAVASGFRLSHVCPFGKAVISYSADEGRTWTRLAAVIDTPLDDRDAGITVFGNKAILTSFNNTVAQQREWAKNYSETQALREAYLDLVTPEEEERFLGSTYKISEDGGNTWGEVMRAPVTAPHGPIALSDGGLLYVGNPFIKVHESRICAYYSSDGIHWELRGEITKHPDNEKQNLHYCEPHAVELLDGRIIVHSRLQGEYEGKRYFTIYQSESSDGGKTWSVSHPLSVDGSPPHLLLHSSGALICVYGRRTPPFGQRVMISRDGGETWDDQYALREDAKDWDLGYPASAELSDGRIITVYYQKEQKSDYPIIMYSIWDIGDIK